MHKRILLISALLFGSFIAMSQTVQGTEDTEKDSNVNYVNQTKTPVTKSSNSKPKSSGIIRVKDSIFMLKGMGGNIGLSIGKDGIFMIDDQFAKASTTNLQRIRSISNKPIELLVNTHHHGDHVGGNGNMAALGTLIFSHANARMRMAAPYIKSTNESHSRKIDSIVSSKGDKIRTAEDKKNALAEAERMVGSLEDKMDIPEGILPVVSFSKDITFNYNGEKIKVIHLPNAHTDGDVMIYFTESNVLHTGDAFFNGAYPFVDMDSQGSVKGHMLGLDRIINTINEKTKIIPGHGDVADVDDVKYTKSMFRFLTERIAFHVVSKKTQEEVLAMKELTKEYDDKGFGDGFISTEKFIKALYKEAAKKYAK